MTSYETIFTRFLQKIEDKDLPRMEDQEVNEMLTGWLNSAIGYIELDQLKIKHDLFDKNDDYQEFNSDLTNGEIEAIAMYMVVAWYEPKINSLQHTLMFIGSKDEKWTEQVKHMNALIEAKDRAKTEARKYFRNYGYKVNSYTKGGAE